MATGRRESEKFHFTDAVFMAHGKGFYGTTRTRHNSIPFRQGLRDSDAFVRKPLFHSDIWICFTVRNWLLDVGRLVVIMLCPVEWCPRNRPSAGDYIHMASNLLAALLLLKRSPKMLPHWVLQLSVIIFVMGTSIHLVGDSITKRLILSGYQSHLPVRDNPIIQNLTANKLIHSFELLSYYDEGLGRVMWGVPFFLVLFLYFTGCFTDSREGRRMPLSAWLLLGPSALHYWYLITEGQIFILFTFTLFAMAAMVTKQKHRGLVPDSNALFLLSSFSVALGLVGVWAAILWGDPVLRRRYPGVMYVPEPWAFYTLHVRQSHQLPGSSDPQG